jgi:hypothetical protein
LHPPPKSRFPNEPLLLGSKTPSRNIIETKQTAAGLSNSKWSQPCANALALKQIPVAGEQSA